MYLKLFSTLCINFYAVKEKLIKYSQMRLLQIDSSDKMGRNVWELMFGSEITTKKSVTNVNLGTRTLMCLEEGTGRQTNICGTRRVQGEYHDQFISFNLSHIL